MLSRAWWRWESHAAPDRLVECSKASEKGSGCGRFDWRREDFWSKVANVLHCCSSLGYVFGNGSSNDGLLHSVVENQI